jgi:hypothetical protein
MSLSVKRRKSRSLHFQNSLLLQVEASFPKSGGERGIRTLDTRKGIPAFQASALSHYATSPYVCLLFLTQKWIQYK